MAEIFAGGRLRLDPGPVAWLTLDAPSTRNAMTQAMWAALPAICARIGGDPAIRVLCVTGANGAFCAGADISEFETVYATEASARAANATVRAGLAALADLPRPVLAVIEGPCVGGGVALALACDLRFAAGTARLAITPAKLGIAYSPGDTALLVRQVGVARAKDLLFSARQLDAAEAARIGLVEEVRPAAELRAAVEAYATGLAALSPASIRVAKRVVNATGPAGAGALDLAEAVDALFTGPDFAEGRRAFRDRRHPRF